MTKILLADDVKLFMALEKTFLARSHFSFLTATNGRDAFALLKQEAPHLAILEERLPEMDAVQIRAEALKTPELAAIPIVITTSNPTDALRAVAADLGVATVLPKPFRLEDLTAAVQELLPTTRRKHCRFHAATDVGIKLPHGIGFVRGSTLNVSAGGMLIRVQDPISMGQLVWVQFLLPGDPHLISARAKVVRYAKEQRGPGHYYGFEFVEIPKDDRDRIKKAEQRQLDRSSAAIRRRNALAP